MACGEGTLIPEVKSMFYFKVVIGERKVGINETNNTFITHNVCMLVTKLLHLKNIISGRRFGQNFETLLLIFTTSSSYPWFLSGSEAVLQDV
jgi:hypothetical protein